MRPGSRRGSVFGVSAGDSTGLFMGNCYTGFDRLLERSHVIVCADHGSARFSCTWSSSVGKRPTRIGTPGRRRRRRRTDSAGSRASADVEIARPNHGDAFRIEAADGIARHGSYGAARGRRGHACREAGPAWRRRPRRAGPARRGTAPPRSPRQAGAKLALSGASACGAAGVGQLPFGARLVRRRRLALDFRVAVVPLVRGRRRGPDALLIRSTFRAGRAPRIASLAASCKPLDARPRRNRR